MKRLLASIFLLTSVCGALHAKPQATPTPTPAPAAPAIPEGAEAQARSEALELAGAFSNDGYKIRDGFYFGELAPGKSVVIEVNLFAGDEYWFCAAANSPGRKIAVKVYNEHGAAVEQQAYENGASAAAGVVAGESGKYLVKVTLAEGETAPICFLYCYK
ncbi:MAG: hypothetical protein ACREKL_06565 [Chthoniobacterales bacterium]